MTQESIAPTIRMLASELVQVATILDEFRTPGFHIYNMEDLERQISDGADFPLVAVAYEGIESASQPDGPRGHGGGRGAPGSSKMNMLFSIVVGVEYHAAGQDDTKPVATDLLDALRGRLLGFSGVNPRPWMLFAEQPLGGGRTEGVIWYGQQWATEVLILGQTRT